MWLMIRKMDSSRDDREMAATAHRHSNFAAPSLVAGARILTQSWTHGAWLASQLELPTLDYDKEETPMETF
jgi:hypothetical protein